MQANKATLEPREQQEIERVRQVLLAGEAPLHQETTADASEPNFAPLPPMHPQNGPKLDRNWPADADERRAVSATERLLQEELAHRDSSATDEPASVKMVGFTDHDGARGGAEMVRDSTDEENPMQGLIRRALAQSKRGRPSAFDDHARGKLVALLALGLSVRQSATVLGVSHSTILRTMAADPELREEITAARYQAQLQPLGCVIREAQRSWRAATWLLKYMDGKLAGREETPEEQREREEQERVENQLRCEQREAAREARQKIRKKELAAEELAERQAEWDAMFPRRKRKPRAAAEETNVQSSAKTQAG